MAGAYFECVNDNGGINGRPIEYIAEEEQVDPQQIAVAGDEARSSRTRCSASSAARASSSAASTGDYYAEQGFYPIIAGVAQACFTSPNFSAVNMGPYYSSLGGAQAACGPAPRARSSSSRPTSPASTSSTAASSSSPRRTAWRA